MSKKETHIPDPLRVASVPAAHAYVRHLTPRSGGGPVLRLPDPPVPGAPAGQWWPSPVLEPQWLVDHAHAVDLVHLHFGFEHRTPAQLQQWVRRLRALGLPLVLTVHDLENPHLHDQAPHRAALDVLVPAAAQVLTLTPGAAAEIGRRWGRPALVVPHPHVVDEHLLGRPRPSHDGFVVGLHAKQRAGSDPAAVLPVLSAALAGLPGARLHPGSAARLPDAELWAQLSGLDVLVLPYLFGTHSGFVELCHDLGTTVVAPRVGHLAEQQPVLSYDVGDPVSLTAAVRRAHDERPHWQADRAGRLAQREELARTHEAVYARAVARSAAA